MLDTAERLFADRGLDAVSVRDITEASRANTAAIHYHFGSKHELIAAIIERRAGQVGERREQLLDKLDAETGTDLRAVVEAMVLPTAEMAASSDGGRNYVAFLAALASHPELMPMVVKAYDPYTERYLATLARYTPQLPADVRVLRFGVAKDLVNRLLGQPFGFHGWIEEQSPGADAAMEDSLVDLIVGMFAGPVSRPRRRTKK